MDIQSLIVGKSEAVQRLRQMITLVAPTTASVLICGPSGSGKELVAQAIHQESMRSSGPFHAINCGAIPDELMEAELFGHEKGAFTGANERRIGRFEQASSGTLFLDEIGDMPYDMQVKLLRVLEDGKISRIGSNITRDTDVRIISATHPNMERAIQDRRFREDLFFRLGVISIYVPPLADRKEDIPLLIAHFQKMSSGRAQFTLSSDAMASLMNHDWPGTLRELRNFVHRAEILCRGQQITASTIEGLLCPHSVGAFTPQARMVPRLIDDAIDLQDNRNELQDHSEPMAVTKLPTPQPAGQAIDLKFIVEQIEVESIETALNFADGIIADAARLLSLKRTTLVEKMRKYGIQRIAA